MGKSLKELFSGWKDSLVGESMDCFAPMLSSLQPPISSAPGNLVLSNILFELCRQLIYIYMKGRKKKNCSRRLMPRNCDENNLW